jgi:hypothetical protein
MVKRTDGTADWLVYHKDITRTQILRLNLTAAATNIAVNFWGVQTATDFVVGSGGSGFYNVPGQTYVVYLFADNAGGFGLTGSDNVITCGSFITDSSAQATVTLGYEPQWLLVKCTDDVGNWIIVDNMRGSGTYSNVSSNQYLLYPNRPDSESGPTAGYGQPTATGLFFAGITAPNTKHVYIAIRRGPMKVPTTGTSVFTPIAKTTSQGAQENVGFNFDLAMMAIRDGNSNNFTFEDRLRRLSISDSDFPTRRLISQSANSESNGNPSWFYSEGNKAGVGAFFAGNSIVGYLMGRAPNFFDEVCYTGTGSPRTVTHNLKAVPELMIVKRRFGSEGGGIAGWWIVYAATLGNNNAVFLNSTDSVNGTGVWNNTTPTSSVFTVNNDYVNFSGDSYVAYLFATCPGVSKVGSFTGTGATQVINCGFTGGARFVLIKSTSAASNWFVWDSARGIVAGNDPYITLNTSAAEVTGTDWVDTAASGFELSNAGGNLVNVSGRSYIFLAIA